MKLVLTFPIILLLSAFVCLSAARTAHILEITNFSSVLLIDFGQAHNETQMLHSFFNTSKDLFNCTLFQQDHSNQTREFSFVIYNGRESTFTKKMNLNIDSPSLQELQEEDSRPMLYEYKGLVKKIRIDMIDQLEDGSHYGRMAVFQNQGQTSEEQQNVVNKNGSFAKDEENQQKVQTVLKYKIRYLSSRQLVLSSKQLKLSLKFKQKINESVPLYSGIFLTNMVWFFCISAVIFNTGKIILEFNLTFMYFCIIVSLEYALAQSFGIIIIFQISDTKWCFAIFTFIIFAMIAIWLSFDAAYIIQHQFSFFYRINKKVEIYRPIWVTTALLIFSQQYPVLVIHTAVNIYGIAKRTSQNQEQDDQIKATFLALLSMASIFWIKTLKQYRFINFPGIFEESDFFSNPPMGYAFMIIVEINIALTIPAVSGFLSDGVAICYRCVQNFRKKGLAKDQEINDEGEGDTLHNTEKRLQNE